MRYTPFNTNNCIQKVLNLNVNELKVVGFHLKTDEQNGLDNKIAKDNDPALV